jgi:hypothetical protein
MTYRAELSARVLGQLSDFPSKGFDALISADDACQVVTLTDVAWAGPPGSEGTGRCGGGLSEGLSYNRT